MNCFQLHLDLVSSTVVRLSLKSFVAFCEVFIFLSLIVYRFCGVLFYVAVLRNIKSWSFQKKASRYLAEYVDSAILDIDFNEHSTYV